MRKAPIRIRAGVKAAQIADWLLGRRDVRSEGGSTAQPFSGPEAIAAVSEIATVYACAMRKSLDKARVPLRVGRLDKKGQFTPLPKSTSEDDPQNLLEGVNPTEGKFSFMARSFAMQQLTGDLFQQIEYLGRRLPRELWLLPSDKVVIVKGDDRRARRYDYETPGGKTLQLLPEQVFHSRLPNPANDWRGLSPFVPARRWAWMEHQIALHESAMLTNGGVPPGFLKFKDYVPVEERDDVRAQVQRKYGGVENAHRMGILWGDAEFFETGQTNVDGQFLELDNRAVRKIAAAAGVPLIMLMDLADASYDNATEQKGGYWKSTLMPELDIHAQDYTEQVLWRIYGDRTLVAQYDYSMVEALQDLLLLRAEKLTRLVAGGIYTQNEARAELGKAPASGGDQLYAPQMLQPTGSVGFQPARAFLPARTKWIDDPDRHLKRVEVGATLDAFEAETLADFVALNERAKARAKNKLAAKAKLASTKDDEPFDIEDFFDLEVEIDQTNAVLVRVYSRIGSNRGQSAIEEVGDDTRFNIGSPRAQEWIATEGGRQSKLIAASMHDELARTLAAANAEGLTVLETAAEIDARFDLRALYESIRIARTETARAYNFATNEGWKQSEVVEGKEWLSALDDATRSIDNGDEYDHRAMDGVVVALDADFEVPSAKGGPDSIGFPSDSKGQPGNTINCRCAMQPKIDGAAKSRKKSRRVTAPDVPLDRLLEVA